MEYVVVSRLLACRLSGELICQTWLQMAFHTVMLGQREISLSLNATAHCTHKSTAVRMYENVSSAHNHNDGM